MNKEHLLATACAWTSYWEELKTLLRTHCLGLHNDKASQRSNAESYVTSSLSQSWSLNQFKRHVQANLISRRQHLSMAVTSFWIYIQRKKLKFSDTCQYFLCKIMERTAHALYVWPVKCKGDLELRLRQKPTTEITTSFVIANLKWVTKFKMHGVQMRRLV